LKECLKNKGGNIITGIIIVGLLGLVIGAALGYLGRWVMSLQSILTLKENHYQERLEDMKKLGELEYKISLLEGTGKGKKTPAD